MHSCRSVSSVEEVISAFVRGEVIEQAAEAFPAGLDGLLGGVSQEMLELGEGLLDGVEVGGALSQRFVLDEGRPEGALVRSRVQSPHAIDRTHGF